ncbi:MAG: DUF4405 domain-containing protein [Anaerolineae bacterium]|nr:DUF4405 domain-containing protein [Anaerolineae bacterium]
MSKPIRISRQTLSRQTRLNWLIDTAVFSSALVSILTGVYFLAFPIGGYQGGRNPLYGVVILFQRATWSDWHVWGGVLMILAVIIHFSIHWQWVKLMTRRMGNAVRGQGSNLSRGAKVNLAVDGLIGLGFLVTAVSGIYFLFIPTGYNGGRTAGWEPTFLFSRLTWDLLHTWGAVVMIVAALLHFAIHWRWVVNVTRRFFLSLRSQQTKVQTN